MNEISSFIIWEESLKPFWLNEMVLSPWLTSSRRRDERSTSKPAHEVQWLKYTKRPSHRLFSLRDEYGCTGLKDPYRGIAPPPPRLDYK